MGQLKDLIHSKESLEELLNRFDGNFLEDPGKVAKDILLKNSNKELEKIYNRAMVRLEKKISERLRKGDYGAA